MDVADLTRPEQIALWLATTRDGCEPQRGAARGRGVERLHRMFRRWLANEEGVEPLVGRDEFDRALEHCARHIRALA